MLTHVEVENFQSLRKLSVELGRFTVVTGATGSGKSSLRRALELLAMNARGTDYISRGAKSCKVGAGDRDQGWFTAIERGTARGKDSYRLAHMPQSGDEPHVETWTKLGGEVPADVRDALKLSELNFARQLPFVPFLLDASGGEVARVLGRLTNVTLLFEAAREANRRRLEISADLKRAEARLASLTEQAQRFRGMKDRQQAVSEAESALERVRDISARIARLRALTDRLEAAQEALERSVPPQVPSAERLEDLAAKLARARSLFTAFDEATMAADGAKFAIASAEETEIAAHERLHEVLVEAGHCPTCGQEVTATGRTRS